jgi:hypothetical protein
MACSDLINELIAASSILGPLTFYHFTLTRYFEPYQPGPVYAVSDSVQGTMLPTTYPAEPNPLVLVAAQMYWAPNSNYLNQFASMTLALGGVYFEYNTSAGTVWTELDNLNCWGTYDSLILFGKEKQQNPGYQIGLPSSELLWIKKVMIDMSRFRSAPWLTRAK